jgi:hypothetical protein
VDQTAIYRKTPKGIAELTATVRTVERRVRPLLILVDGHRTATRIHALINGIGIREEDFDKLETDGFIEIIARPVAEVAANDDTHARPGAPPATVQQRSSYERYSEGQQFLCETATEKLGLMSFLFVLKLEKCSSAKELMALLPEFERALSRKFDEVYAQRCRRIAETILHE